MTQRRRSSPSARTRILFGITILSSILNVSSCAIAHTTTHVDAWAKAGESLDIRIVVVLHDVLRYENIATPDEAVIPADEVDAALQRFGTTLLNRMQVYDDSGHRLDGSVLSLPRWKPNPDGVRLSTNSALRLTWQLRYPWRPDEPSLSIRHRFEPHVDATLPKDRDAEPPSCELRLHVLQKITGRRIDAVVPPARFHTIRLPANTEGTDNRAPDSPVSVGIILTPGRLTHEFTALLTDMENRAWSGTRIGDDNADAYPRLHPAETRKQIGDWADHQLALKINGQPDPPLSRTVVLLSPQGEIYVDENAVPLIGTRLGIRTVHVTSHPPEHFSARWNNGLGDITSVAEHVATPSGSTSQLVDLRKDNSESAVEYTWDRSGRDTTATSLLPELARPLSTSSNAADIWKNQRIGSPDDRMILAAFVLTFLSILLLLPIRRTRSPRGAALFLIAAVAVAAIAWKRGAESTVVDTRRLADEINRMLNRVYESTTQSDDRLIVDGLSSVLTSDMTERLFSEISGSLLTPSDEGPLISINDVSVTDCRLSDWRSRKWVTVNCSWVVSGNILHWGHIHNRRIQMSAGIRLQTVADSTRISEIHIREVTID